MLWANCTGLLDFTKTGLIKRHVHLSLGRTWTKSSLSVEPMVHCCSLALGIGEFSTSLRSRVSHFPVLFSFSHLLMT